MTEKLVDPKTAVRVARFVELLFLPIEVIRVAHELVAQPPAREAHDVAGIDDAAGEVGAGDHVHATVELPRLRDRVEQALGAALVTEDAQQQEIRRRRPGPARPQGETPRHGPAIGRKTEQSEEAPPSNLRGKIHADPKKRDEPPAIRQELHVAEFFSLETPAQSAQHHPTDVTDGKRREHEKRELRIGRASSRFRVVSLESTSAMKPFCATREPKLKVTRPASTSGATGRIFAKLVSKMIAAGGPAVMSRWKSCDPTFLIGDTSALPRTSDENEDPKNRVAAPATT